MANKYSEYIMIRYFNANQTLPVYYTDIDGEGSGALLDTFVPFPDPKNIKIGRFTRFADNTGSDSNTWPYNVTSLTYPNSNIWYSYKTKFNDTTSDTQQYHYYYYSDPKWWELEISYNNTTGVTAYLQYQNLDGSYVWKSTTTKEYKGNTCDDWSDFTVVPYASYPRTSYYELYYYAQIYVSMRKVNLNTTKKEANIGYDINPSNWSYYTKINPYTSSPSAAATYRVMLNDNAFSLSSRVSNYYLSDGRLFIGFTVYCEAHSFDAPTITKIQNSGDSRITTFYNPNPFRLTMYYSTKKSKKSTARSWYENESSNRSNTYIDAKSSKTITIGDQAWYDDKWIHAVFIMSSDDGSSRYRYYATTTTDTSTSNTKSYWNNF